MDFPELEALKSESDVEQKIAFPILSSILGYEAEEIRTKHYLAPTTLDKGAGKKNGYFPDYVIYLGGVPVIVIEVKDVGIPAAEAYREARLYSLELNKLYPEGINPVKYIIGLNGVKLIYSHSDTETEDEKDISDLVPGSHFFSEFTFHLRRPEMIKWANEIRAKINPRVFKKPLKMLGGPSRQNEKIPENSFAEELVPVLRRYFDPSSTTHEKEILEKGYCSSGEIMHYNSTLEALLKDVTPSSTEINNIETTAKRAESFDHAIKSAIENHKEIQDPLIMLLGGVGVGKSTFIERYFKHLISRNLQDQTYYIRVNFNDASDNLENVESWITKEVVDAVERDFGLDFFSHENIKQFFADDLKRISQPLKLLEAANPSEYASILSKKLLEWFEDKEKLCFSVIPFLKNTKGLTVVVAFDNIDRRDRDQQLKLFQVVQWFRSRAKVFSILSLRDETFDAFKDKPPLDAFLKPFAFRISPPRFFNVVRKRLEMVLSFLSERSSSKLFYNLPNGTRISYPNSKVGSYLMAIYKSIFNPTRKISLILEAVSGRNIRRALEIFTEILVSGYFNEKLIFSITEGQKREIPEWLVIRALMRTSFRYYSETHGFVFNIFDLPNELSQGNIFLIPEILEFLSENRKNTHDFQIEGYILTSDVVDHLSYLGYFREDSFWALEKLLVSGLIIADHQRTNSLQDQDYIKITASGYYHARLFPSRTEYLHNVAFETLFSNELLAKEIVEKKEDYADHKSTRIQSLIAEIEDQKTKLMVAFPGFKERGRAATNILERISRANRCAMEKE